MTTQITITKVSKDDAKVVEIAAQIGCEPGLVAAQINREAYRKAYSSRPDVKEKRAEYSRQRNEQLKVVAALLKLTK